MIDSGGPRRKNCRCVALTCHHREENFLCCWYILQDSCRIPCCSVQALRAFTFEAVVSSACCCCSDLSSIQAEKVSESMSSSHNLCANRKCMSTEQMLFMSPTIGAITQSTAIVCLPVFAGICASWALQNRKACKRAPCKRASHNSPVCLQGAHCRSQGIRLNAIYAI